MNLAKKITPPNFRNKLITENQTVHDITKLILKSQGLAINPKQQLLFDGINLRTYQMAFTFTPYSKQEADAVTNIINTFKKWSRPQTVKGAGGTEEKAEDVAAKAKSLYDKIFGEKSNVTPEQQKLLDTMKNATDSLQKIDQLMQLIFHSLNARLTHKELDEFQKKIYKIIPSYANCINNNLFNLQYWR